MTHSTRWAAALLLLSLAACGSTPPTQYYILDAGPLTEPQGSAPFIGVGPITLPDYLQEDHVIAQRDGSKLSLASYARWAEPLRDGIARVLLLSLASGLDTQHVQHFPWRRDQQPDLAVKVEVIAMDASDSNARLIAQWNVQKTADGTTVLRQLSHLNQSLEQSGQNAVPEAYSALIQSLGREISAAIRSLPVDSN